MTDWLELCIPGTYQQVGWGDDGPYIKEVKITPERLQKLVANFKPEEREPVVMVGHYPYDQKALAWVCELKYDNVLLGKLKDVTPTFQTIIAHKEYKYFSIGTDFYDLEDEKTEFLEHLACTNFPLVGGMKNFPDTITGIKASHNVSHVFTSKINFKSFSKGLHATAFPENLNEKKSMNAHLKIIAGKLGVDVNDSSKEEDVTASSASALDKILSEKNTLKDEVAKLKADNDKLSAEKNKFVIDSALEAGKITEAEKEDYEKLMKDSPETTAKMLAAKQPSEIFKQNSIQAGKGATAVTGDLALTDKEDYDYLQKNDPEKLEKLKASKPEDFKKLWEKHYKAEMPAD